MSFLETIYSIMAIVTKTLSYSFLSSFFILALISPRSQRARLYLNTFIYVSSLGVCSIFGVLCGLFLSLFGKQRFKTNYFVSRSFYLLAGTLTGIKFKVTGEEHFKDACPAVLVGNHQTGIDILYLGRIFPKFASIMAKQELKYAPLLGQFSECRSGECARWGVAWSGVWRKEIELKVQTEG